MPIRKIELYGSPVLRERAENMDKITPDIQTLLDDMVETMHHAQGVGLAAQQVGVVARAMVVDMGAYSGEEKILYFLNPEVISREGEQFEEEGCLSIPQIFEKVRRPQKVKVRAMDRDGKAFEMEAEGFLSRALCHEIDHIDGVLFVDHLSPLRRDMVKRKIKKLIREGEWDNPYPQE
ncbi:MAG: peptide deformylase [Acidobacteriota bacterium]